MLIRCFETINRKTVSSRMFGHIPSDKDDSLSMEESKLRILELRHLEITFFFENKEFIMGQKTLPSRPILTKLA